MRSRTSEYAAAMDPRRLAERQIELDHQRTATFPELLARKRARMSASPLAFLRGAAPLFYELLAQEPELSAGPDGSGVIQGDAHLENFGAYSPALREPDGTWTKGEVTFQLNDFDEASFGAWRWDVLRLTTSLLLAGRELGQPGPRVLELCELLLESHSSAVFSGTIAMPAVPPPVADLIAHAEGRSRKQLLSDRTRGEGSSRRFVLGERYLELPATIARDVPAALALYAERTAAAGGPKVEQLHVEDVAFRVAGTGSLGALRVAALTNGKGGADGGWLFDLKEQTGSSVDVLFPRRAKGSRAAEVEAAFRACLDSPPRMLGTSQLGGREVLVRRLAPQEDKLSLTRLKAEHLPGLASYLGALLGRAHRRGADGHVTPWSGADRAGILERAIRLAGIHEATYLQLCRLWKRLR